ncbi:hypothetical protein I302_101265 [Kwoniella bestiolae CBS 10118]|uniref:Uncharacterized protein n=1 Tax=Kwoniella bestiolae CBS 10118 TaxID=1296100 RepID=A0A1B9G7E7_9TREE|nr:hypothetical protein I302_04639 [Kwoniella bestiolae CBS 10118]OCF26948.1 hypothetical protein I302_04639 [Kwoniella bestiolae CBS 10118]
MSNLEDILNTTPSEDGLIAPTSSVLDTHSSALPTTPLTGAINPTIAQEATSTDTETLKSTSSQDGVTSSSTVTTASQVGTLTTLEETSTESIETTSIRPTELTTATEHTTTATASSTSTSSTSEITNRQSSSHTTAETSTERRTTFSSTSSLVSTRTSESYSQSSSTIATSSISPIPPPVPFTSTSEQTITSYTSTYSTAYETPESSTSESYGTVERSQLALAHLEVESSSGAEPETSAVTFSSSSQVISIASSKSSGSIDHPLDPTASDGDQASETGGPSATLGADSAQSNSNPDTNSGEGGKLSSVAIVGIVGGVLVGLILLYLAWYQWRKRKAREAMFSDDDTINEKFSPMHHNRITGSSFGAADPITPYHHRQRGNLTDDDEDWYDPSVVEQFVEYPYDNNGRRETQYMVTSSNPHFNGTHTEHQNRNQNPFEDNLFYPTNTSLPISDGRTTFIYNDEYEGEMNASLAEDMSPELLRRNASQRSEGETQGGNPFVPPIPTSRLGRNETVKTVRTIPAVPSDVDGISLYESFTGDQTRPQSEYTEPPTSNLLPWINKGNTPQQPEEPIPSIPQTQAQTQIPKNMIPHASTNLQQELRQPPRAMMNRMPDVEAPKGHGGELAEIPIPSFR